MTIAKVTQQDVEVLVTRTSTPKVRVTQQDSEVLTTRTSTPKVRVTQQDSEVLTTRTSTPKVRVTQQDVEVLIPYEAAGDAAVTTEYAETISKPSFTNVGLTTEYAEGLSKPLYVNAGLTTEYIETLYSTIPDASITAALAEVLTKRINVVYSTCVYSEILYPNYTSIYPANLTNMYLDILVQRLDIPIRASAVYSEILTEQKTDARNTSIYSEILNKPEFTKTSLTTIYAESISKVIKDTASIIQIAVN